MVTGLWLGVFTWLGSELMNWHACPGANQHQCIILYSQYRGLSSCICLMLPGSIRMSHSTVMCTIGTTYVQY